MRRHDAFRCIVYKYVTRYSDKDNVQLRYKIYIVRSKENIFLNYKIHT